jgi:hypothetical protein
MPLISRSIGRKIFATIIMSVGLVFVYETTIRDSRSSRPRPTAREQKPRRA